MMQASIPEVWQGVAPILGPGRSCFLSGAGHVSSPPLGAFGSSMLDGFYIGLDLHAAPGQLHTVCGAGTSRGTRFIVRLDSTVSPPILQIEVADDHNSQLSAKAALSTYAAKRLLVAVEPGRSVVEVFEVNVLDSPCRRDVKYEKKDSLSHFSDLSHEFIIGGANLDGGRIGSLTGRIAEFFINDAPLGAQHADALVEASQSDIERFNGPLQQVAAAEERRAMFRDDLESLRAITQRHPISRRDLREASNILFRWLFDRYPLLLDAALEVGLQMTLPGESARRRAFHEAILEDSPVIQLSMHLGMGSLLGHEWVPVGKFGEGLAVTLNGYAVRIEPLVKFVRNKLGGGHFDERERKKWQRDLVAMSNYVQDEYNFMSHHVQEIAKAVLEGVAATQLEETLAP